MLEKLKSFLALDHTFYGLLLILVGIGGFLLGGGEVKQKEPAKAPLSQESIKNVPESPKMAPTLASTTTEINQNEVVVASKTGTKYHLPTCPGASQIKAENRLEFANAAAATAAGYKPAANCPGLVQ